MRLISILGRMASYLSHDVKEMIDDVIPVVPVNMKRSAIAAIAMLHETAEPLFQELRALELDRTKNSKPAPTSSRGASNPGPHPRDQGFAQIGYLKKGLALCIEASAALAKNEAGQEQHHEWRQQGDQSMFANVGENRLVEGGPCRRIGVADIERHMRPTVLGERTDRQDPTQLIQLARQ